jgi:uncharacterized protein YndB with AHSA1/START domain
MSSIRVSSEMPETVERIFHLFTDVEHAAQHVSAIKKTEMLTTGTFSRGTRWLETREVLGRLDKAEMEVTAFETNASYTITHHKGGVRIDTTFTFEPIPSGTKVSIEFALNSQGLPPGLLSPLEWAMAGKVRDVLGHDLADLKTSVEKILR